MNFDLRKTIEQIKSNKNFLKLRDVVENNAYHDNEPVFDHLIKTYGIAVREINANFITNKEAKEKFDQYTNGEVKGIKKKDLMLILALIHDIGKTVKFEKLDNGSTNAKGHEYEGSLIVPDFVEGLPKEVTDYLSTGVRLHGVFNDSWNKNKNASPPDLFNIVKQQSEGIGVELVFNSYCDCFTAKPFQPAIPLIHQIFNERKIYT